MKKNKKKKLIILGSIAGVGAITAAIAIPLAIKANNKSSMSSPTQVIVQQEIIPIKKPLEKIPNKSEVITGIYSGKAKIDGAKTIVKQQEVNTEIAKLPIIKPSLIGIPATIIVQETAYVPIVDTYSTTSTPPRGHRTHFMLNLGGK